MSEVEVYHCRGVETCFTCRTCSTEDTRSNSWESSRCGSEDVGKDYRTLGCHSRRGKSTPTSYLSDRILF